MKTGNDKRTVLIVDDEKVVLDVEGLMLKKMGFNILKANSSKKAYSLYTTVAFNKKAREDTQRHLRHHLHHRL